VNVVSLFSGVGGFDLGLERAGMSTVAQVEWDAKCQQVLARHWPDVPRWGDVSDVNGADLPDCDLVAFGSPCQDLSVAGKRAGMVEGETRSGLFYEAIRIIEELQHVGRGPAWVVWENVVGALSSNRGLDFAAVVDSLAGLGAVDVQWRVLDAQWFGVAQRRRRVFVVARLDSGAEGGPQVLPVGASVRRDSPPGNETGQEVAGTLGGGSGSRGWAPDTDRMTFVPAASVVDVVGTLSPGAHPGGVNGQDAYTGQIIPVADHCYSFDSAFGANSRVFDDQTPPIKVGSGLGIPSPPAVAFAENQRGEVHTSDVHPSLSSGGGKPGQRYPTALQGLAVRRLTPRECERLMGWPDDWTAKGVNPDGNPVTIADSSRYRMCGNGVASPVAEWVGRCIISAEVAGR